MDRIVECVPNFSEGRNPETIDRLVEAIESAGGAVVLGTHVDADHNRSVITFVAPPESAVEAAVRVVARAAELIDMNFHQGEHPRLGATDVLPFVPLRRITMDDCVRLAHAAGAQIAGELSIPIYFYGHAAMRPDRVNLEDVRRKGFEQWRREMEGDTEEYAPDLGPKQLHATAGATIIGARPILIAYNVNLNSSDIRIARQIAKKVRARDGGLPYLKALGFELHERGLVQVSMNLLDYEKTSIYQAFEAVRREAESLGVQVVGSEIVGLVPQAALKEGAERILKIESFTTDLVLENRISSVLGNRRG